MTGRTRVRSRASKDLILEAAERVVARRGPAHLTLDAVAAEAGLSKGGLLYNFPSKQSLVEGMIDTFIERHRHRLTELRAAEGDGPNAAIRSMLTAKKSLPIDRGTGLAILAGLAENPELLAPLRREVEGTLEDLRENSADPMLATLVWLASDGLEFWNLLGICPFDEAGRGRVDAYMASLVGAEPAAPAASGPTSEAAVQPSAAATPLPER